MKRSLLALMIFPLVVTPAFANGGYSGPSATKPVTTAAAASEASDDEKVVLQGRIVKQLQNDLYEFKDATGTITVDIDDELWPMVAISEHNQVRLRGEVDREVFERQIDVDSVELIN
ncbi:YgiW/YdeI family stress tolerance OB fold protein [Pseudomonas sp. NPDC098747]|uniref:YgiW/YdeI family stress tolerance OB fold protein n=1 Tax=Pseudomonas sp. NPDC098747 TaxID=3364487 RepID=UPI00383BA960